MKNLLFNLVVALLIPFFSFSQIKEHKEYYDNGKIKAEGKLKIGKKEGKWIFYHCDGKSIWLKGEFKNGLKEGEFVEYGWFGRTDTYHKRKSEFYKQGKLDGKSIHYHENGSVSKIDHFKYGEQHGESVYINEDGKTWWKGVYKHGILVQGEAVNN